MQKHNWVLSILLLVTGVVIFLFSIYSASLSGLRRQLGLVGGDLTQNVDTNRLYRGVIESGSIPECGYYKAILSIPKYIFEKKNEPKILLGLELAKRRAECAIVYTLAGNTERGVYAMLKSLRYNLVGLMLIEQEVKNDRQMCSHYQTRSSLGLVEAYIDSVDGTARDAIGREYKEVQRMNNMISELCNN